METYYNGKMNLKRVRYDMFKIGFFFTVFRKKLLLSRAIWKCSVQVFVRNSFLS